MRVFYDHQIFTLQRYGGISRYFREIVPRIATMRGSEVSLSMGLSINRYGLEKVAGVRHVLSLRGVDNPAARVPLGIVNNLVFQALSAVLQADVYHPTYYGHLRGPRRARRVVTVHDMTHEILPDQLEGRGTGWVQKNKRLSVENADLVLTVSESTKRDLVAILGVDPARVRVTHLATSMRQPQAPPLPPKRPFILYVGSRAKYKNFARLLECYAGLPEHHRTHDLVCFGGGPFSEGETKLIASRGLGRKVRQEAGADDRLAILYSSADLFVYPSQYEGFGIPALEAMQLGCPVLASNASSLPEVVGEAGMLFDPNDPADLASKIRSLLTDSRLRERLSVAGRKRARQFTWEKCASETLDAYRAVSS